MWQQVLAHRYEMRTERENVGDLHHRVDVEPTGTGFFFVVASSGVSSASISALSVGLRSSMPTGMNHANYVINSVCSGMVLSMTKLELSVRGSRLAGVPRTECAARYFQHLSRFSAAFAIVSDTAMGALGGSLKRREKISGRLADGSPTFTSPPPPSSAITTNPRRRVRRSSGLS